MAEWFEREVGTITLYTLISVFVFLEEFRGACPQYRNMSGQFEQSQDEQWQNRALPTDTLHRPLPG